MKLAWVLFVFAASTINCTIARIRVKKEQEIGGWTSEVQCVDDTKLQENENDLQKRIGVVAAATVFGAAFAFGAVIQGILTHIGEHSPKIGIVVVNNTPYQWKGINVHFHAGESSKAVVERNVPPSKILAYGANGKLTTATGAIGVIALYIPDDSVTLYVLFSVPYDRHLYSNSWNVKIRSGRKRADENIYDEMYKNSQIADDSNQTTTMDFYYKAEGAMTAGKHSCGLVLYIERKLTPGTVVSAATVIHAIPTVLKNIAETTLKISIGIINDTPHQWEPLNVYFEDGKSDVTISGHVPKGKGFNYSAKKKNLSLYGATGVIALYIPHDEITLCVLYSVPYGSQYSNLWNVKSFPGKINANKDRYESLYYLKPVKSNKLKKISMDFYYSAEGKMSSSSKCTLELHIKKNVTPGKVVSAATVIKAIPTVLEKIREGGRKISVGIINDTPYQWERLNEYFRYGTSDIADGSYAIIPPEKGFNYAAREDAAGLIALYIPDEGKTLHIFFSVSDSKPKWNFEVHRERKKANEAWYYNLNKSPVKANGTKKKIRRYWDYTAEGTMSSSIDECTLELHIIKKYFVIG